MVLLGQLVHSLLKHCVTPRMHWHVSHAPLVHWSPSLYARPLSRRQWTCTGTQAGQQEVVTRVSFYEKKKHYYVTVEQWKQIFKFTEPNRIL